MEKNNSCFPVTSVACPVLPLANYELNARILADNAPANGASLNGVHYILTSPVNLPVANRRLEFSVNGSANLIIPTYYTNNSGALDVALTNTVPETVQLNANLADDTSVSTASLLTFTPVGPIPTYELTSRVVQNDAAADGISQNAVEFYLTYGGSGVSGTIIVTDLPTHPPTPRTTGSNGFYTAYITSSNPGSFIASAYLQGDPSVSTSQTITFAPVVTYPVFLGSNRVSVPLGVYFLGIESFFGPLVIKAGHRYSIRGIPTSNLIFNRCPYGYTFEEADQVCGMDVILDFTLLTNSLTPVIALSSGVGENLHSEGYYFNDFTAQVFTVDVYDEGPA
ncbi:hypothetical protein ABK905_25705 [Acerihabitans sp. KWT182]|uniref:Big-1 domain-containing protein n=1 Tax=Acerihabitans sp. KWT182 TaxID=3157919 RepID=A0AAU7QBA9_9GAMM